MSRQCGTKKKYGNKKLAEIGMWRLWRWDWTIKVGDLHVYFCPECRYWHIGHVVPAALRVSEQNSSSVGDKKAPPPR